MVTRGAARLIGATLALVGCGGSRADGPAVRTSDAGDDAAASAAVPDASDALEGGIEDTASASDGVALSSEPFWYQCGHLGPKPPEPLVGRIGSQRPGAMAIAVSPAGTRFAISEQMHPRVTLWEAPEGRKPVLAAVIEHAGWTLAYSPDSAWVVRAGADELVVHSALSGAERWRVLGLPSSTGAVFTRDGRHVMAGGPLGLRQYGVEDGRFVATIVRDSMSAHFALSPDDRFVAVLGYRGPAVYRLSDGSRLPSSHESLLGAHHNSLRGIAYAEDGSTIAYSWGQLEFFAPDGASFGFPPRPEALGPPQFTRDGRRVLVGDLVADVVIGADKMQSRTRLPAQVTLSVMLSDGRIVGVGADFVPRIFCPQTP